MCFRVKVGLRARVWVRVRAKEPERPDPHDLVGAGTRAGAILFFLQQPELELEHFKN